MLWFIPSLFLCLSIVPSPPRPAHLQIEATAIASSSLFTLSFHISTFYLIERSWGCFKFEGKEMVSSIESDIEIKSPADKFFKRLSKELYHVPNASENVHGVEVLEGDFETQGSVKVWSYTIGKQSLILNLMYCFILTPGPVSTSSFNGSKLTRIWIGEVDDTGLDPLYAKSFRTSSLNLCPDVY